MNRKVTLITLLSFFFLTCFSQSFDFDHFTDTGGEMIGSENSVNEYSQSGLTAVSGLIPLYDSISYYSYSLTNGSMNLHAMDKNFVYDAHGNKLSSEYYIFYNSWYLDNTTSFSYNTDNRLTRRTMVREYLNDTIRDIFYDYDNNGNRTLYEKWEELQNEFCVVYRESNTYDNNSNILVRIVERRTYDDTLKFETKEAHSYLDNKLDVKFLYRWLNGTWTNDKKNTYSYNVDGRLSEMLTFKFESGNWTDEYKYLYAYNSDGNLASRTRMTINTGEWLNSSRISYTYIADKKLTEHYEVWNENEWLINFDFRYQYDDNLNLVYRETYEVVNGEYLLLDYDRMAFDIDNIMTSMATFYFNIDELPPTVALGDSTVYNFKKVVGVDKMDIPPVHLSIYPNPTSGVVTIDSSTPILCTEVYSLTGEHILTVPGKAKYIDLSSNPAGVYLMKVITDKEVFVRKVVVK